jgi:hypothetical protein
LLLKIVILSLVQVAQAVILATQEAEFRRIEVRSQPRQIVCEILSPKKRYIFSPLFGGGFACLGFFLLSVLLSFFT